MIDLDIDEETEVRIESRYRQRMRRAAAERAARFRFHWVLGEDGRTPRAVDPVTWAAWFEAPDTRALHQLATDRVRDVQVRTHFTGMNVASDPDLDPILFQTLVITGASETPGLKRLYTTRDEALVGHGETLALVRAAARDWDEFHQTHHGRVFALAPRGRHQVGLTPGMQKWLARHATGGWRHIQNELFGEVLLLGRSEDAVHFKLRWV